jgi:hypothetical protein
MAGLAAAAGPALLVMGQLAGSLKAVREAWPIVAGMAAAGAVPTAVLGASAAGAMADAHTNAARGNTASVATAADRQIDAMVKAQMEHAKSIEALNAVRLKAAPVDQAAFELSIKQAEAHKKGGIAVAAIATATKEAAEELRLATWAEAVQMETRQRGNAAAKSAVSVISDLVNAGEAWGKKLEYMTATQKDSYLSLDFLRRSADGVVDAMRDLIRPSDTLLSIMGALGPKVSTAEDAFEALGIRSQASLNTAVVKARDALNILTEMYRIGKASPEDLMRAQDALRRAQEAAGQGGGQRGRQSPLLQISTIVTDFSRAISDVIFQAKSFGDAMKQVGQSILQSLVRGLVETGVSKAVGALGKLASSSGALGKVLGSIFGGIGGSAAGSAAGSIVGSTAGTAVGGAIGSAAGGAAGGAASGATSAAASGLTGAINLVTGAVSAVANVVQAFQLAHIGKDTGRMEESLRGILNVLALNGGESIHHFAKQSMFANVEVRDYWRTTGHSLLVQMTSSLETMVTRGTSAVTAGGPPITINIYNAQFTDAASLDRQLNEMGRRLREVTGYRR